MAQSTELDIRNGNWLVFSGEFLHVDQYTPGEFKTALTRGQKVIALAATSTYERTRNQSPEGARVHYPWIWAIKLADYAETFVNALTPEAQLITNETHSNDSYPRALIRPRIWPYLDSAEEAGFIPNVPGRINGWDQQHDGIWIQIKSADHYAHDNPTSSIHTSPEGSTRWPTLAEEAEGIIPRD